MPDEQNRSMSRRGVVQRAAVGAGAVVWAAPVLRTFRPRRATGSPPPTSSTPAPGSPPPEGPPASTACRTQGYWKNHADPAGRYDATWDAVGGPTAAFFDSGRSYLEILQAPPRDGNAFLILAHQWIAARLNMAAGASSPSGVQSAFRDATDILTRWSADVEIPKNDGDRARAIELADVLDAYNNGRGCS